MTDVPADYDEKFPALDGFNNNNSSASSLLLSSTVPNSTNIIKTSNNVTNSWSHTPSQTTQITSSTGQQHQTKLNYLLLATNQQQQQQPIQQIYQQQQPQQPHIQQPVEAANHLGGDSDNNSNDMVSQCHIQPQQPQTNNNSINTINNNDTINNNNNNNTMHSNSSIQQKRLGLPNPIISSEKCCSFKIASEERRYRDFEMEQSKILKEIMQKTNTKIEVSTTKDGALNFCIIGKEQSLPAAKNLVLNDFQTSVTLTVSVPKSIHGRLLGQKGQRLATIQDETQTKIAIPRKEDDSDIIKIVGLKNNAEMAVRSIQKCAREFAGKAIEKVSVDRIYLLFITGPFNENLKRWEEMGAKVSTSGGLLPSNNEKESGNADKITFTIQGETTAVNQVKDEIIAIYEDKKKKCTTVNMEVKKAQHKYILGPGGQNLRTLFAKTGVSVELPQESESETITLRGERSKLAPALSELYTQAHSETDEYFEAETWLHKYLIGVRKTNYIDFKARGVDVKSLEDKIRLHGPPSEVEDILDVLETELETVRKTIIRKDIRVEPRIHGYIIGKAGATVDQIREESGAFVLVPKNDEPSEFITLEGAAEAVALAEEKINAIAKKYEASRKLVIDQQLHGSIIGRGGEKIRSIREKFTQVVFTFPEQGSKNNEITILGPADEVEECYKYLDEFHKQLQENNYQVQVPIKKDIIKYLPDAQSAIKRIKGDHKVKVDLFIKDGSNTEAGNNSKSASTTKHQQKANESTETAATNVSGDTGVTEGGKKKGKGKKKQQGNEVATKTGDAEASGNKQSSNSGNNSNNNPSASTESCAVIIGKKEDVDQAKVKIVKLFEEMATTTELEVKVSNKLRPLLGPKSRTYRQLLDEFQQKVVISFPPTQQKQLQESRQSGNKQQLSAGGDEVTSQGATGAADANGVPSSTGNNKKDKQESSKDRIELVKLRGPKNIVIKAEKRFEALVAECQEKVDKNFSAHVMVDTAVIEKFLYSDKIKLNKIRDTHSVKLNLPDRRDTPQIQCTIVGYEKSVQAALKQFTALCKEVEEREEETIEIASQVHPRLIGAGGRAVKKLMEDFKVGVKFARQGDPNPDSVTLTGRADCILAAKNHMMKLAEQYLSSS